MTNNDLNQNDTDTNSNQDNTSTPSTAKKFITQLFQTQQPSHQNYDPPPLQPHYATHNALHNSPL